MRLQKRAEHGFDPGLTLEAGKPEKEIVALIQHQSIQVIAASTLPGIALSRRPRLAPGAKSFARISPA